MKTLNTINNVLLEIVTIGCVLFFIGCNSSNDVAPARARLIKITPAVSEIERYTPEMELVFDKPVAQVEVNGVDADPKKTMSVTAWRSTTVWTLDLSHFEQIHPPTRHLPTASLPKAQVCFTVSYVDETGIYQEDLDCVEFPPISTGASPWIIEGTVLDGDVGVDAEKLNIYGITLRFSAKVTGYLIIHPEGQEESLCWNVEWSEDGVGESVRLHRGIGKKLLDGRAYTIAIDVQDGPGNKVSTDEITFTTAE